MGDSQIDRIRGLVGSIAMKAPCRVATIGNITLSGFQTIDGVVLDEDDDNLRIAVVAQTNAVENGIYDASGRAWRRSADFDGARDATTGTLLQVISGTDVDDGEITLYKLTTPGPIVIGTTALEFSRVRLPEDFIDELAAPTGAGLIGWIRAKANAVATTLDKWMQRSPPTVFDFMTDAQIADVQSLTASLDVSASFVAALAAHSTIEVPFGKYKIKDVVVSTTKTINCNGAVITAATGASCIFKLTGFKPTINDAYFDDASGNLTYSLGVNGAVVVEDAAYPELKNCQFTNVNAGLTLRVSSITTTSEVTKGNFSDLTFDTITKRCIYIGPNVNTCTFSNSRGYVGVEMPDNRPRRGCIGVQIVSTGSLNAYGGHILDAIDIEQAETGFQFTDATLVQVSNCFADSLAGQGYQCTGACTKIKFSDCLAGTCLIGFDIANTCSDIWLDSIDTFYNGTVPPWWVGPGAFFIAGSPFDVSLKNTSSTVIGSWFGDKKLYADPGITLVFDSANFLHSDSTATIAAATTRYFGPAGPNASEFSWVFPRAGVITNLTVQCDTAPGSGQSFVYTTRINSADQGQIATVTGAASFSANSSLPVTFAAGVVGSVKLVTSAAAAAANHRLALTVKFYP